MRARAAARWSAGPEERIVLIRWKNRYPAIFRGPNDSPLKTAKLDIDGAEERIKLPLRLQRHPMIEGRCGVGGEIGCVRKNNKKNDRRNSQ